MHARTKNQRPMPFKGQEVYFCVCEPITAINGEWCTHKLQNEQLIQRAVPLLAQYMNKTGRICDVLCSGLILLLGSYLQACELSALFALSQICRLSLAAQRGENLWQLLGMRDFRNIVHMLTRRNSTSTVVSRPLMLIIAKDQFNSKQDHTLQGATKVDSESVKWYWLKRYKQFRSRMLFKCMEPTLFADSVSERDSSCLQTTQTDVEATQWAWQRKSWVRPFQYLLKISTCEHSHYCRTIYL